MSAGVPGIKQEVFFFLRWEMLLFSFFSNDPVSREVMMSQEGVELNSQEGGNI